MRSYFFASTTLPPFAAHSAAVVFVCPWPLQAFLPAQELLAPAQLPFPLQALIPEQITWSPPAFSSARAVTAPDRSSVAAAVASTKLFVVIGPPWGFCRSSMPHAAPWFRRAGGRILAFPAGCCYRSAAMHVNVALLGEFLADHIGEREAIVWRDRTLTYAELNR